MTGSGSDFSDVDSELKALIRQVRVGALATLSAQGPTASHVPFIVADEDWRTIYVHLSALAQHAKNLSADPRVGLFFAEPDAPEKNPLSLKRVSLQGTAVRLERDAPQYAAAQTAYLDRFKQAKMMFELKDFSLWELRMDTAQFVAGFGRAFRAERQRPSAWDHQRP
jgi:putative heme iron utilization protein